MSLFRINNILVPVDLSESSLNALDAAVVIAKKHNASIQLLHVEENSFNDLEDISFNSYSSINNTIDIISALIGALQHTHGIKPLLLQKRR